MKQRLLSLFSFLALSQMNYAQDKILVFVSHENTYYSEYIVLKKGLEAAGYEVDVRNASGMETSTYMIPNDTTINETANSLSGSSYDNFTYQFLNAFGQNWNENDNITPTTITVDGTIQSVTSMNDYKALVVVGGTGALDYRVDGEYSSQGEGNRQIDAQTVQVAAEKLNSLALEALEAGKPVMAQCHGASLPAFWRLLGNGLGESLLQGQFATGFPESTTPQYLSDLGINHRTEDRVTISSTNSNFSSAAMAKSKVITTRDWYPQTVAHATRCLLNIIETYPSSTSATHKVLVIHGGSIDINNCSASNRNNDVPCNYGDGDNLPADYTHIMSLLNSDSAQDSFDFDAQELNLTSGSLPFDNNNQKSIEDYLLQYGTVFFFKHWNTGMTDALQNAIVNYADQGGGVIALHHGLYNDSQDGNNKNILTQQLFGAESHQNTWSANRTTYSVFNSNLGHFITTYGINMSLNATQMPQVWNTNPLPAGTNPSFSTYQNFSVFDEIYNNMTFLPTQAFGHAVNEVTILLSNDQTPASQVHTTGFVKKFNASQDDSIGRVAFFEIGENRANFGSNETFGQIVRNAVTWVGANAISTPILSINSLDVDTDISIYPNPANHLITINGVTNTEKIRLFSLLGQEIEIKIIGRDNKSVTIDISNLHPGIFVIQSQQQTKLLYKN